MVLHTVTITNELIHLTLFLLNLIQEYACMKTEK